MRLNDTTRAYFETLAGHQPARARRHLPALLDPASAPPTPSSTCANTRPATIDAAHVGRADDAQGRRRRQRHSVGGRSDARHPRAAGRRHRASSTRQMAKVIGDPAVKIVPIPQTRPPSPASRLDTEMYA